MTSNSMNSPRNLNRIVRNLMRNKAYIAQRDAALERCRVAGLLRDLSDSRFRTEAQLIAEAEAERDARRRGGVA